MYMLFEEAGLINSGPEQKEIVKDRIWKDIRYVMKGSTHEKESDISNFSGSNAADRNVLCTTG